ncbi:MAG: hypothetical protein ACREC5_06855 [Thermoplasmata archaeon]
MLFRRILSRKKTEDDPPSGEESTEAAPPEEPAPTGEELDTPDPGSAGPEVEAAFPAATEIGLATETVELDPPAAELVPQRAVPDGPIPPLPTDGAPVESPPRRGSSGGKPQRCFLCGTRLESSFCRTCQMKWAE